MPNTGGSQRLVYDGECSFCTRHVARPAGRGVETVAAAHAQLDADQAEHAHDTVLWQDGARTWTGSAAVVRAMWAMRGLWRLGAAGLWLVPKPLRDAGYRWVARNRHRF